MIQPDDVNWQDDFAAFHEMAFARMERGAIEYGNKSFGRDPAELLTELEQEAIDLANWGFVLWRRIQEMRVKMAVAT